MKKISKIPKDLFDNPHFLSSAPVREGVFENIKTAEEMSGKIVVNTMLDGVQASTPYFTENHHWSVYKTYGPFKIPRRADGSFFGVYLEAAVACNYPSSWAFTLRSKAPPGTIQRPAGQAGIDYALMEVANTSMHYRKMTNPSPSSILYPPANSAPSPYFVRRTTAGDGVFSAQDYYFYLDAWRWTGQTELFSGEFHTFAFGGLFARTCPY